MNRIIVLCIVAILLSMGCKKKTSPTVEDTPPPPPTVTPIQKESPQTNTYTPPAGAISSGGGGSSGLMGGGGGGAAQAVRKAARRTQALNELKNLGLLIEDLRNTTGRMPMREQIMEALKRESPTTYKAIEEGSYILTGTMDGSGLWAYEVDADKQPGIALIGSVAQRTTPDQIQPYLLMK